MLTPPGPTSSPTMISKIPYNHCLRTSMTIPAMTRITAMSHSMKSMSTVYPGTISRNAEGRAGRPNPRLFPAQPNG